VHLKPETIRLNAQISESRSSETHKTVKHMHDARREISILYLKRLRWGAEAKSKTWWCLHTR